MSLQIRRVVTGHDQNGRAIVTIDEISQHTRSSRPGLSSAVIWATDTLPPDNNDPTDGARVMGGTLPHGSVFRIGQYDAGCTPRIHRSNSLDYAVVLSGEMTMQLDDGIEVVLRPGDTVVQRGTVHNWINRGSEPCVMAFVLIGAPPVEIGGKPIDPIG